MKNKFKLLSYRYSKVDDKFLIDKRIEDLETLELQINEGRHLFFYAGFRLPTNKIQQAAKKLLQFGSVLNSGLYSLICNELVPEYIYRTSSENLLLYTEKSIQSDEFTPFTGYISNSAQTQEVDYDDVFFDSDILWLVENGYTRQVLGDLSVFTLEDLHNNYHVFPNGSGFSALKLLFKKTLQSDYLNNPSETAAHAIWRLSRYIPKDTPINATLTIRLQNSLAFNGIKNYYHLSEFQSSENIKGLTNLGLKSLLELESIVKDFFDKNDYSPVSHTSFEPVAHTSSSFNFAIFLNTLSAQSASQNLSIIASYIIELSHVIPKQIPIIEVLSIRTSNVLSENYITHYHQFSSYDVGSLLALPKFGLKSLSELYEAIKLLPAKYSSANDINSAKQETSESIIPSISPLLTPAKDLGLSLRDFTNSLTALFVYLNDKEKIILKERVNGSTLEEIGQIINVSRQRVRQIQVKGFVSIHKLIASRDPKFNEPASKIIAFLNGLLTENNNFSTGDVLRAINLIKDNEKNSFISSLINMLLTLESIDLEVSYATINKHSYLLPFYKGINPDKAVKSIKKWLDQQKGLSIDKICSDSVLLHSSITSPYFISILTHIIISHTGQISKGVYSHDGNWKPEQAVMQASSIVMKSSIPMKLDSIYSAMPESYRVRFTDSRRLGNILTSNQSILDVKKKHYLFNISYGYWCTWQHTYLTDSVGQQIVDSIQSLLSSDKKFQFSDQNIFEELKKKHTELNQFISQGQLKPHIVSVLLNRYRPESVEYLGRNIWRFGQWTDKPNSEERIKYNDLLKEYLLHHQQLVTEKDFLAYVSSLRGSSKSTSLQVPKNESILWLTPNSSCSEQLIWHKELNPISPDSGEAQIIFKEAVSIVGESRSFTNLKFMLRKSKVIIREYRFQDMQLAALLCQSKELTAFVKEGKLWFSTDLEYSYVV
jgi:hypothetical protein